MHDDYTRPSAIPDTPGPRYPEPPVLTEAAADLAALQVVWRRESARDRRHSRINRLRRGI